MFGAVPAGDGLVEFRVWAPRAKSVSVLGHELAPEGDGVFAGRVEAQPGDDYATGSTAATSGPTRARASSPKACAGRRASSTRARSTSAPALASRSTSS